MRVKDVFEHLKVWVGATTATSAMAISLFGMYVWTKMDALEVLLIAAIIGAAADLLSMAVVDGMYSMLRDDVKAMDARPRRKSGH